MVYPISIVPISSSYDQSTSNYVDIFSKVSVPAYVTGISQFKMYGWAVVFRLNPVVPTPIGELPLLPNDC